MGKGLPDAESGDLVSGVKMMVWGEVGNETGAGLRTPVYRVNELVFYPGAVREP